MDEELSKILTIDDNQDNLTILKVLIVEAFPGAVVLSALNGQSGMDIAAKEEPDMILIDINMPGMDGYEVCQKLKADKKLCDIPVVFITAIKSNKESRIKALECCADAFLTKPIDEIELTAQIRAMLKIRVANIKKRDENERLAKLVEEKTRELKDSNTELTKLVEAVKRDQALMQSIFDSIPGYLYVYDESGRLIKWNKKHETMTGYTGAELSHMTLEKWFAREDIVKVNTAVHDVFEKGYGEVEAELILKNGEKMMTRSSGVPLILEGQKYFAGIGVDITQHKKIEHELKQSEEKFQLLFNKAPLGYQSLDFDGRFIEVNQQWLDTLGFSREEVIGKWFGDFLCPEFVEGFRKRFSIFKSQGYIHSEFEMLAKDGQRLTISFEGRIGYGADGAFKQTHCILQDITNQRKAEKALIESEERYKYLFEHSGVGIGYYTKDGVVISYNKKAMENIGGKPEDYIGKSFKDLFPKEQADIYYTRLAKAISSDQPQEYEDYLVLNSGPKWFSSTFTRVLNITGEVLGIQIASLDITERKHAEEELNLALKFNQDIIGSANEGIIVYSNELRYKIWNPYMEELTGLSAKEVIGRKAEEVFPWLRENGVFEKLERALNGKKPDEMDFYFNVAETKHSGWVRDNSAPLYNSKGEVVGVLGIIQDISERKIAEDNLIFMSCHDPLTGLYNRRFFEDAINKLDKKENLPISIIMADVNGLKLINDSFGHDIGDDFLKKAADTIIKACRTSDVIARLGGDEFAVILPKTDSAEVQRILVSIKNLAANIKIANIELSISLGYDTKDQEKQSIVETMANTENDMYRHKIYERSSMRSKTVDIIMNTLFEKSNREMLHSQRVSIISEAIATMMDYDKDEIGQIRTAGLLHDIGKIGIDEKTLNKNGKPDDEEWKELKKHPEMGWRILSSTNEFSELSDIVIAHHEKWDGSGYPNGLKGEEIPQQARIITVADAYDAMTSERSYRKPLSKEDALEELKRCSGSQFDPKIVDLFLNIGLPRP